MSVWNYQQIKQEAKTSKRPIGDYLALAPQNDPFYTGAPAQQEAAEWCHAGYQAMGYDRPEVQVHIRRLHYAILSRGLALPNGLPYENTEQCWDYLLMAAKAARYLRLISPEAIIDRRNDGPILKTAVEGAPALAVVSYALDHMGMPDYQLDGYTPLQAYHLEIWCEKTTMNDVLEPLCSRYQMNLQTCSGEPSITAVLGLVQRIQASTKPARVFYISDFDPAGQSMPVAVARKLEYFMQEYGVTQDVRLFPVALSAEQVQAYNLPRTPIKESERRAARFEARYGQGAVELDALEALYPGELENIMRQAIERYYDVTLEQRTAEARQGLEQALKARRADILANHQTDIKRLRSAYATLKKEYESLSATISRELQRTQPDLNVSARPMAASAKELGAGLYHSARPYQEQMTVYKQFQGKAEQKEASA